MQPFNYQALGDAAEEVQSHTRQIHTLNARLATDIVAIGQRLLAVREAMPAKRQWSRWLKREFRWSSATAYKSMRVAERFAGVAHVEQFQPSALVLLAREATDPKALAAALELAASGEQVTAKRAAELCAQFAPKKSRQKNGDHLARLREFVRKLAAKWPEKKLDDLAHQLTLIAAELVGEGKLKNRSGRPRKDAA